jgi:hypothetical protein
MQVILLRGSRSLSNRVCGEVVFTTEAQRFKPPCFLCALCVCGVEYLYFRHAPFRFP